MAQPHTAMPRQLDLVEAIDEADRVPALLFEERRALEYISTLIRSGGKPTATLVGAHLGQDTAYGAVVIEGLIRKEHLACQFLVLRPLIRDFVRFGRDGQQEVVR